MLIYDGDDEITDYTIIDQITLNWSPLSEVIWTHGKKIVHRLQEEEEMDKKVDPLAARVRERAKSGFGSVKNVSDVLEGQYGVHCGNHHDVRHGVRSLYFPLLNSGDEHLPRLGAGERRPRTAESALLAEAA